MFMEKNSIHLVSTFFFAGSKMVGWQLCSDITYPLTLMGKGFPPLGPVLFTLRLQKLDKGLNQYLLEAAYTFVPQVGKISDMRVYRIFPSLTCSWINIFVDPKTTFQ